MSKKFCLVSVSDKSSLELVLPVIKKHAFTFLSTGGTYEYIKKRGYEVISVDEYTSHPEILEGRVKTLHPKIYGGILNDRNNRNHQKDLKNNGVAVIPNFYTNPINVIGVSLQDVDTTNQEKEINICTRGITSVLVSNKGDYLSTNGNVDKNGLFGIINYEGRIVKTNRKPIDNYICGGQFIETGSINEDKYFLFNNLEIFIRNYFFNIFFWRWKIYPIQ